MQLSRLYSPRDEVRLQCARVRLGESAADDLLDLAVVQVDAGAEYAVAG